MSSNPFLSPRLRLLPSPPRSFRLPRPSNDPRSLLVLGVVYLVAQLHTFRTAFSAFFVLCMRAGDIRIPFGSLALSTPFVYPSLKRSLALPVRPFFPRPPHPACSGEPLPAAGFGFGDAVIAELLSDKGLLPKDAGPGVTAVVFAFDADLQVCAMLRCGVFSDRWQDSGGCPVCLPLTRSARSTHPVFLFLDCCSLRDR